MNTTVTSNVAVSHDTPGRAGGIVIYNSPGFFSFSLLNTVIAYNTADDSPRDCGPPFGASGGTLTSDGHNLASDGTCALAGPGDQNSTDPLLGPLQDNGGPTPTRALMPGSPAIDAGDDAGCPATDQRGATRPQGAACDIGAYEVGVLCGDGVVDAGEECDDHNQRDGDCCSSTCHLDAEGTSCTGDGDPCTTDRCDGAGTCLHVAAPRDDCRSPTEPARTRLALRNVSPDTRDALRWRWSSGSETSTADFGDPRGTTGYALCVFDDSTATQPLVRASVPGGAICGNAPCWGTQGARAYRYRDRAGTNGGVESIVLHGGEAGDSHILFRAAGPAGGIPSLPLTPGVTVQLTNLESGVCWAAKYSSPTRNDNGRFRATAE